MWKLYESFEAESSSIVTRFCDKDWWPQAWWEKAVRDPARPTLPTFGREQSMCRNRDAKAPKGA